MRVNEEEAGVDYSKTVGNFTSAHNATHITFTTLAQQNAHPQYMMVIIQQQNIQLQQANTLQVAQAATVPQY